MEPRAWLGSALFEGGSFMLWLDINCKFWDSSATMPSWLDRQKDAQHQPSKQVEGRNHFRNRREVTWHSSINRKQAENRRDQISVNSRAHKKNQTHFMGLRWKYKCNPYDKLRHRKDNELQIQWEDLALDHNTLYYMKCSKGLTRKLRYSVSWFISPRGKTRNSSPYQNKGCAPWKTLWASEAENQRLSRPFDCNHQYLGYVYLSPFVCLVTFLTNAENDVIQQEDN